MQAGQHTDNWLLIFAGSGPSCTAVEKAGSTRHPTNQLLELDFVVLLPASCACVRDRQHWQDLLQESFAVATTIRSKTDRWRSLEFAIQLVFSYATVHQSRTKLGRLSYSRPFAPVRSSGPLRQ